MSDVLSANRSQWASCPTCGEPPLAAIDHGEWVFRCENAKCAELPTAFIARGTSRSIALEMWNGMASRQYERQAQEAREKRLRLIMASQEFPGSQIIPVEDKRFLVASRATLWQLFIDLGELATTGELRP